MNTLGDGLRVILAHLVWSWIAVFRSRPREIPMKVRMGEGEREATLDAEAARLHSRVRAEQHLTEPQGEPLLAHSSRTVEQETRRQRAPITRLTKSGSKLFVTVESDSRHRIAGKRDATRRLEWPLPRH